MIGIMFLVAFAGVTAWKMADMEDRTPWPWMVGALLCTWGMLWQGSVFYLATPLVSLALVFAGLWILRSRDGDRGGKVIR